MTTVTAVKRALEEARDELDSEPHNMPLARAMSRLAASPTALTVLANGLSDRGTAPNQPVTLAQAAKDVVAGVRARR